jgi:hypothetical protein
VFQYSPVKAGSVPFSRVILYCSGVRDAFHSASDLTTFFVNDNLSSEAGSISQ